MITVVGLRENAEYLAPAAMVWFVLHTCVGRITALALLLGAAALGLLLGGVNASDPLTLGALALYGAATPLVLFPLAIRERKRREQP
jgi:hypothetical protein